MKTQLKTIKEIDKIADEFDKFLLRYKSKGDIVSIEDFRIFHNEKMGGKEYIDVAIIKQEAIKWIKEHTIEEVDLWSQGRNMGLMRMAEFLNITEEDLQ